MKGFWLLIGFVLLAVLSKAQDPSGLAAQPGYDWYKYKFLSATEGFYNAQRDTTWKPGTAGVQIHWRGLLYYWNGARWEQANLSFNNIADLAGSPGVTGAVYKVSGFYTPGDGGGGDFYWDDTATSAPVQGMIIQVPGVATGRFKRKYDGRINLKWMGVKGDGSTNEKALILSILSRPGMYYIPEGTYLIDGLLTLTSGINVEGAGEKTVFAGYNGYSDYFIKDTAGGKQNITLKNFTVKKLGRLYLSGMKNIVIDGIRFDTVIQRAIHIVSSRNVTVRNCFIDSAGTMGISVEGGAQDTSKNIQIVNNKIRHTGDDGIAVRAINGSVESFMINDNVIDSAGKSGIKATVEAASRGGTTLRYGTINGNTINGWGNEVLADAINADSFNDSSTIYNITIQGNSFRSSRRELGDSIEGVGSRIFVSVINGHGIDIIGNTCQGYVGLGGIHINQCENVNVIGNIVDSSCQWYLSENIDTYGGIDIKSTRRAIVSNNIVYNNGTDQLNVPGILMYRSQDCIVSGNNCYDNQETQTQTYGIFESTSTIADDPTTKSQRNFYYGNFLDSNKLGRMSVTTSSTAFGNYNQILNNVPATSLLYYDGTNIKGDSSQLSFSSANGFVGIGSSQPTHALTLGRGKQIAFYNTDDEITNLERAFIRWNSNQFEITTRNGGTGTVRDLVLGTQNRQFRITDVPSSSGVFQMTNTLGTTNAIAFVHTPTFTANSGVNEVVKINAIIQQGGGAGYALFHANARQTTTGGGNKYLFLGTTGVNSDTTMFSVDNTGITTATKFKVSALNSAPSSSTDTGITGELRITADFIYVCIAPNTWVRAALTTF